MSEQSMTEDHSGSEKIMRCLLSAKWFLLVSLALALTFGVRLQAAEGAPGKSLAGIVQVVGNHAIDKDDILWSWDETHYSAVPILTNVKQAASGDIALKKDGSVWVWGLQIYNWVDDQGHFSGLGSSFQQPAQIKDLPAIQQVIGTYWRKFAIDTKGNVWEINGVSHTAKQVEGLKNIVALDVHTYNSALDNHGDLWIWGLTQADTSVAPKKVLSGVRAITGGLAIGNDWTMTEMHRTLLEGGTTSPEHKINVDLRTISATTSAVSGAYVEGRSDFSFLLQNNGKVWTVIDAYPASKGVLLQQIAALTNVSAISAKGMGGGSALHRDGTVSSWSGAEVNQSFNNRFNQHKSMAGFPIKPVKVTTGIGIKVNGTISVMPTQPQLFGKRVYIPVRGLFESLGGKVGINGKLVTISYGMHHVELELGTSTARIDGETVQLDDPIRIENGRTMVPFRFIGEALGASINWNHIYKTVEILL
ncbi:copper amine oxidase N-terminal domain-containing protein [Paenibacillus sp. YIM B09110]|uniref:copper amine oxidase N-terminal domain-containing protein n=1 Tax=Paenibacillus sp. YIM B09110 TaxID=3126102 RepID=UPI00301D2884